VCVTTATSCLLHAFSPPQWLYWLNVSTSHEPNELDLFLLLIFLKDYFISFSRKFCPSAFCVRVSDDAQGRRMLSVTCRIPLVIRQGHQVSQQVTPP
jgi:hypothetical protein